MQINNWGFQKHNYVVEWTLSMDENDLNTNDSGSNAVKTLTSVESMINSHQTRIEKLKKQAKPIREMINDYLTNDESYNKLSEIAKKASGEKSARKKELMQAQNGKQLQAKLDAIKESMNDSKEALSDYLSQYRELTGSSEYETPDGELKQIVYTARLVRKKA